MSVELKPIMDALRKLAADTTIDLAGKLYNADLQIKSWSAQAASDRPRALQALEREVAPEGADDYWNSVCDIIRQQINAA